MSLEEILLGGGGVLLAARTLIQVAPIKVNPWSAVAKAIGRAINGGPGSSISGTKRSTGSGTQRSISTRSCGT